MHNVFLRILYKWRSLYTAHSVFSPFIDLQYIHPTRMILEYCIPATYTVFDFVSSFIEHKAR